MRIAILTYHRAYNCGAALQAWALKVVLERMGHSVEFPVLNHVGELGRWVPGWVQWDRNPFFVLRSFAVRVVRNALSVPVEDLMRARFRAFRKSFLAERHCSDEQLADNYDLIVVGSDQVWSAPLSGKDAPVFFAESLPTDIPKIGYGISYGDTTLPADGMSRILAAVPRFRALSFRERIAQEQVFEMSGVHSDVVLDPTLLLTAHDYGGFTGAFKPPKEPYLFLYALGSDSVLIDAARRLAERLGVRAIMTSMYQYSRYGAPQGLTYAISPDRLVGYVANARYVLTSSFHGTALATIFRKPFLSMLMERDSPPCRSRVGNLLKTAGDLARLVTPQTPVEEMIKMLNAPVEPSRALEEQRRFSIDWLKDKILEVGQRDVGKRA